MSLILYDDLNNPKIKEIASKENLSKLANLVNMEILRTQMQDTNVLLPSLIKIMKWTQNELSKEIKFPQLTSINLFYKGFKSLTK